MTCIIKTPFAAGKIHPEVEASRMLPAGAIVSVLAEVDGYVTFSIDVNSASYPHSAWFRTTCDIFESSTAEVEKPDSAMNQKAG